MPNQAKQRQDNVDNYTLSSGKCSFLGFLNEIGKKIKAERIRRGFTQTELGDLVGITHPSLSAIERGRTQPARKTLIALARILGTTFGEAWLEEHLASDEGPKSKREIAEELTARELISLKFGGETGRRRSTREAEMLAKLLDAEVERIRREGFD